MKTDSQLVKLMNSFCNVLISMERNGITIDIAELTKLEVEYTKELNTLKDSLESLARKALGDTPFNLSSNDDLSKLIYSRVPISKKAWAEAFNLGTELINGTRKPKRPFTLPNAEVVNNIRTLSTWAYKTKAYQCQICRGGGRVAKLLNSGSYGKVAHKCSGCNGVGIIYSRLRDIAGFKQLPSSVHDLAVHGYKCNKVKLEYLAGKAQGDAKQFLTQMVRYNAVSHYLSSFIKGIKENVGGDGVLHTQFMQCVTTTGRLSSRNPNFHNQPRGGTFPIRRVVISRWDGGNIVEADYAQLEFRVAADLAKDDVAKQDIIDGVDVHQFTAAILTSAGQPTSRQDAKTHTFKPLYGGLTGTRAEKTYYKSFLVKYDGIRNWHTKLLNIVDKYKALILPSGRKYTFVTGIAENRTKIKNYPVQGFATADIVPLATVLLDKLYKKHKLKSLIINEVHDSIVTDAYPGEETLVADLKVEAMLGVIPELKRRFDYDLNVPLEVEVKCGKNWLDMNIIKTGGSHIENNS